MEMVYLNDVFEFVRNGASIKQSDEKKGFPITRIETIWNETIDVNRFGYADLYEDDLKKYEKYLMQDGDILMTHINSPKHLGKCALYNSVPDKLIHGMNLLCLRPNKEISHSSFLKYYFNSTFFKTQLPKISNQSVNQASFSAGNLKKLKIPLPPLAEQKHIAAILDAADSYRQQTRQTLDKYNQLAQSIFLDMFGDPVTNPMGWEKVEFKELFEQGKVSIKPENIIIGDKYIGLEHIEKVTGGIIEIVELEKNELKSNKFWFNEEYVLYGKLRPYLNKVAVPNFEGICSTDIIPFKPIKDKSTKSFLVYLMRGNWFVNFANENTSGANLPRISPKEINKFRTINPPIQLQNQFANKIANIEAQKATTQQELAQANNLFNALLQKAFKGQL
ncbi:MAG: restriction endonuclease subunit S [Flavobacteriaceae bacterium]